MSTAIAPNQDAEYFYQQGVKSQQVNNLAEAETNFRQAIELDSENYLYYHRLGEILTKQDQLSAAIATYQQSIQLKSDFFWSHHCLAMTLLWQSQYQDAFNEAKKAIAINGGVAASYDVLGKSLYNLGKIDEAVKAYQIAIKLSPDLAIAYHNLGDALLRQSNFTPALKAYEQAIALNPQLFWSYYGVGQTLVNLEQYDLALKFYQQALTIDPNCATIYSAIAQLEQRRGNYDLAADNYQQAITLFPSWELPYTMLQYLPVDSARLDRLVKFYRQITAKHANAQLAWGNLGDALTQQGKLAEATECYRNFCYQNTIAAKPHLAQVKWRERKQTGPDFIIIGAGKCGTSSLQKYIAEHPQVVSPHKKEINFFHGNFNKGVDWYLAHFPAIADSKEYVTGEASPVYFHAPLVDQRIHNLFPDTKLIVLLRNPVDRAVSWHYHEVKCGLTQDSPQASIKRAIEQLKTLPEDQLAYQGGHILESLYYYKLKRWMSLFPPEQFLILKSEDFFSQPSKIMAEVFDFLGLPEHKSPHYEQHNRGLYVPIEDDLRTTLTEYFQPYNQKLETYLNRSFGW